MNQITLTNIFESLKEEPITIEDRLVSLGYKKEQIAKKFSQDLLATTVYASSFIKFLNENRAKFAWDEEIPATEVPKNFRNILSPDSATIAERLKAINVSEEKASDWFNSEVLNLSLTGDEFQDFLSKNEDKFLDIMQKIGEEENG